jgi:hypothetical protein
MTLTASRLTSFKAIRIMGPEIISNLMTKNRVSMKCDINFSMSHLNIYHSFQRRVKLAVKGQGAFRREERSSDEESETRGIRLSFSWTSDEAIVGRGFPVPHY